MLIYPAIDLFEGCAVRLFKGDYNKKTIYSTSPLSVARDFVRCGATHIHLVDLDGAKSGTTPNFEIVREIKEKTNLFCEIGGGIRTDETVEKYIDCGIDRVILGTAAVKDRFFLERMLIKFGKKIAVGIDIRDGRVSVNGWTEDTGLDVFGFCSDMQKLGVKNIICTDISKDGAMLGTNRELYRDLSRMFSLDITASGGVSSIDDIITLKKLDLYGAIIGKAYYIGAISLREAIDRAQ